MKKIYSYLFAAVAIIAAVACNKEIDTPKVEKQSPIEFIAESPTTKTALGTPDGSGTPVNWVAGDQITINGSTFTTSQSGATAVFTTTDIGFTPAAEYNAIYPATAGTALTAVTIPSTQTGAFKDASIIVAKSTNTTLQFKHLVSVLKFRVPEAATKVTISTTENIAGTVEVTFGMDGKPVIGTVTSPSTTITVNGTFAIDTDYYVAVLPGIKTNLTVRIDDCLSKASTLDTEFKKGVIMNLKTLPASNTIKAFAKKYIELIPIWEATTGTVNYIKGVGTFGDGNDVENAHYIPENTKVTVAGVQYNLADVIEIAERSYLLLRGWDGNSTTAGKGTFPALLGKTMDSAIPTTHNYIWGESPYNETGSTSAGNVVVGNGGPLRMGNPVTADGVELAKLNILDNFAQRHVNYPITRGLKIANMCGYAGGQLTGYYGCFSAKRGLVTYAFFFKYLLDNNLDDAQSISEDQTFTTYLFGAGIY